MKSISSYLLFLGLILHTHFMLGQYQLSGVVKGEDQIPIADASVFLNNTSFATKTDSEGVFSLDVPGGNYELVVYKYGFSSVLDPLLVNGPKEIKISLRALTVDLVEQEVSADRDPEWYRNFEVFKTNFLGTSRNGRTSEILNPTTMILDADKDQNRLKAWSNQPILIRNHRLGYDIAYVLESFEKDDRSSSYAGFVSYQDIPGLSLKKKHFRARERAYLGSTMHFVRSLIAGNAKEQGYVLYKYTQENWEWVLEPAAFSDLISREEDGVYLTGSGRYELIYNKERPEIAQISGPNPSRTGTTPSSQVSEFEFLQDKVKLLPSGGIDPPLGMLFRGYMGWEKIGDSVPLDYQPRQ